MLLSAMSLLVVAQSSSEIPEGLMNNPVYIYMGYLYGEGGDGVKWARDLISVRTVRTCGLHGGFMLLPSYV